MQFHGCDMRVTSLEYVPRRGIAMSKSTRFCALAGRGQRLTTSCQFPPPAGSLSLCLLHLLPHRAPPTSLPMTWPLFNWVGFSLVMKGEHVCYEKLDTTNTTWKWKNPPEMPFLTVWVINLCRLLHNFFFAYTNMRINKNIRYFSTRRFYPIVSSLSGLTGTHACSNALSFCYFSAIACQLISLLST